jgi:hypothetical protein
VGGGGKLDSAGHLFLAGLARLTLLFLLLEASRAGETLALAPLLFTSLLLSLFVVVVVVITPVAVLLRSRLALRRTVPADVTSAPSLSSALNH